jgi:hypothetical protein
LRGDKFWEELGHMPVRQIDVQRFTLISSRSFDDVLRTLEAAIGRPDPAAFRRDMASAKTSAELERLVERSVGPSGLMEFLRLDIGAVLRLYHGEQARRSLRLLVGNPVIMKQMAEHVPDTASYAPVTLLIDERADGVHLTYDRMASFLAQYGSGDALKVARDLDAKIETLLTEACG